MSYNDQTNNIREKVLANNSKRWADYHYVEDLIAKCDQSQYKSKLSTGAVRDALQLFLSRPNLLGVAPNDKVVASIIKLLVAYQNHDANVKVTTKELRDLVRCKDKALLIGSLISRTFDQIASN